jgi:hypothetical protein
MTDEAEEILNRIGCRTLPPIKKMRWQISVERGKLNVYRDDKGYTYSAHVNGGIHGITGPRLNPFELLEAIAEEFPELVKKMAEPMGGGE